MTKTWLLTLSDWMMIMIIKNNKEIKKKDNKYSVIVHFFMQG